MVRTASVVAIVVQEEVWQGKKSTPLGRNLPPQKQPMHLELYLVTF